MEATSSSSPLTSVTSLLSQDEQTRIGTSSVVVCPAGPALDDGRDVVDDEPAAGQVGSLRRAAATRTGASPARPGGSGRCGRRPARPDVRRRGARRCRRWPGRAPARASRTSSSSCPRRRRSSSGPLPAQPTGARPGEVAPRPRRRAPRPGLSGRAVPRPGGSARGSAARPPSRTARPQLRTRDSRSAFASAGRPASTAESGPASDDVRVHQSSNDGERSGTGSSRTATSTRPASTSSPCSRPASSRANGPGMPGGGIGTPICAPTASNTTPSHGLRVRGPQTAMATRPPGRRTRAISPAARAGSDANISPSRQRTASYVPSGSAICSRSRERAVTLCRPIAAARVAAMAVISATTSDTTTVPSGPTSGAAASPRPPGPQASSSTRSPGRSAAAASSSCVTASPRAST